MKLPKLHLRDLFWLLLVCGMAVGWWVDRGRWAKSLQDMSNSLQDMSDEAERRTYQLNLERAMQGRFSQPPP